MTDRRLIAFEQRRELLAAAVARLAPRLRGLVVAGILIAAFGSLALAAAGLDRGWSFPVMGAMMVLAGIIESGIAHNARGDGPALPWQTAGAALVLGGGVAMCEPLLPPKVMTGLAGIALLAAGFVWMRIGFALPDRLQVVTVQLAGGFTALVGILVATRWAGDSRAFTGGLLALELIARGWSWIGFGVALKKRLQAG